MRLFPSEFKINFDEGFSEENDLFNRKPFGDILTKIISSTDHSLSIVLEGNWGTGKTTFLKLWAGELKKQNFPVIFFDAFEADFHSDAFLPLVAEIVSLAQKSNKHSFSSDFAKKASSVGKIIVRSAMKIGVKAATLGALEDSDLTDVASDISSAASDAVDKHVTDIILGKEQEEAAREAFSSSLSKLVNSLNKDPDNQKPLIFIIDELDRARPDFSLSILEKIKHFFSKSQIHFIFGANLDQIRATINHTYGANTNSNIYLEKFVNFSVRLDDNNDKNSTRNTEIYAKKLADAMELPPLKDHAVSYAVFFLGKIAAIQSISFRSIERIMTNIAVVIASTPDGYIFPPAIVAGIAILKSTNNSLFNEIMKGNAIYEKILSELGIDREYTNHGDQELNYARREWELYMGPSTPEIEKRFHSTSFYYNFDRREDVVRHIAERFARPTLVRIAQSASTDTA